MRPTSALPTRPASSRDRLWQRGEAGASDRQAPKGPERGLGERARPVPLAELGGRPSSLRRQFTRAIGWTRASTVLFSGVLAAILLVVVIWWPLVLEYFSTADPSRPIWLQLDWLLLGIFAGMSGLIMARADMRRDLWIVLVGACGGLAIESWGTNTELWTYYTFERPPLWIIPAWPIASLSIDRLVILLGRLFSGSDARMWRLTYGLTFTPFVVLMVLFIAPTISSPLSVTALLLVGGILLTCRDHRAALLHFAAGAGLGYFLELWGTTRACWTYYTLETPPLFAVFAHGMAAVAFWRAGEALAFLRRGLPTKEADPSKVGSVAAAEPSVFD